jgi:hypothetical protein
LKNHLHRTLPALVRCSAGSARWMTSSAYGLVGLAFAPSAGPIFGLAIRKENSAHSTRCCKHPSQLCTSAPPGCTVGPFLFSRHRPLLGDLRLKPLVRVMGPNTPQRRSWSAPSLPPAGADLCSGPHFIVRNSQVGGPLKHGSTRVNRPASIRAGVLVELLYALAWPASPAFPALAGPASIAGKRPE